MKSTASSLRLNKAYYNATPIANVLDNAASAPITNIYVSLHPTFPGLGGAQNTNEAAYSGYARAAVARTTGGWTCATNTVVPASAIVFPTSTQAAGVTEQELFFATGDLSSGAGVIEDVGVIGTYQGHFTGLSSTNVLTVPAVSGLAVNSPVIALPGVVTALPSGITAGTIYYVKTVTGDQVTLSATQGGATLALTTDGGGMLWLSTPLTVGSGGIPTLSTGTTIYTA